MNKDIYKSVNQYCVLFQFSSKYKSIFGTKYLFRIDISKYKFIRGIISTFTVTKKAYFLYRRSKRKQRFQQLIYRAYTN